MNDRPTVRPGRNWAGAVLFSVFGLVVGLALAGSLKFQPVSEAQDKSTVSTAATLAPLPGAESPFVAVVDRALPAVVSIDTRRKVGSASGQMPDNDLFRRFFGDPQGQGQGDDSRSRRRMTVPSSGSGFIMDREGRILTNNHVVRDADEITVTLLDHRKFKARVIGADEATDVAVVQITGGGSLPVLPLGDSDRIKVGEWVMAMGNPLGELEGSVTAGIVSARGRSQLNIAGGAPDYQDFIQTDASINFGNSGGPLVNLRGEAIGINTAINAQGQGIGFAIPINLVRHIAEQLVSNGKVVRGFIGVFPVELTPDLAESYGIATDAGVVVQEVTDNSPAARAGVHRGDVITAFDGQRVNSVTAFRMRVADTPVDKRVPVALLREGKPMTVQVTMANRDVMLAQATGPTRGERQSGDDSGAPSTTTAHGLGVTVRTMDAAEQEALGPRYKGVVVTQVEEDSPADEAGIEEGDLLLEANGRDLAAPADLAAVVRTAKTSSRPLRLLVASVDWSSGRMGGTRFVPIRLKE
jgi:serine protease Do